MNAVQKRLVLGGGDINVWIFSTLGRSVRANVWLNCAQATQHADFHAA